MRNVTRNYALRMTIGYYALRVMIRGNIRGFTRKLREILIQIIFFSCENQHSVTYATHGKAGLPYNTVNKS